MADQGIQVFRRFKRLAPQGDEGCDAANFNACPSLTMDTLAAFTSWLKENKDALGVLTSLLTPIVAIVAALVSYRAVVTGPRTQLAIAKQQFQINERQLETTQKQIALQKQQAQANVFGTYEQKWIDGFLARVAEFIHLMRASYSAGGRLVRLIQADPEKDFSAEEVIVAGFARSNLIVQEVRLMVDLNNILHLTFSKVLSNLADSQLVRLEYDETGQIRTKTCCQKAKEFLEKNKQLDLNEEFLKVESVAHQIVSERRKRILEYLGNAS